MSRTTPAAAERSPAGRAARRTASTSAAVIGTRASHDSLSRSMSLIGTLSEIKLADVLRLFASSKKTGLLTASGPGGRETLIRFQKGVVVHASAGRLQGEDAVLDLFGCPEGRLTFVAEEKVVTPNVAHGVAVLVLEGEREGGAFHRLQELIPSDRVSFQLAQPTSEGALCSFGPPQWKVLCRVDGVRDVRD